MSNPIVKSTGLTSSEQYLAKICERTFLRLWSYPNPYRNQGGGKELCDLLVVCGDDVIIFSDKSCDYPSTGKPDLEWSRWYRRAIEKSAQQIFGAERWIRERPDQVFLDCACDRGLPIALPTAETLRIHRVVVALGAKSRCRQELGGSGSLWLFPDLRGTDHVAVASENFRRFHIGGICPEKGFVHVLDDVTLDIILGELDTITDFTRYLRWKEDYIQSNKLFLAQGEENLLAAYLSSVNDKGQHDIVLPTSDGKLQVEKNLWERTRQSPEYLRKRKANEDSYFWDRVIDDFADHVLAGTIIGEAEYTINTHEMILRVLARESRLDRRMLVLSLKDHILQADPTKICWRTVLSEHRQHTAFVFGLFPQDQLEEEVYRKSRCKMMQAYCYVLGERNRKLRTIVGMATESHSNNGVSEDLVLFSCPEVWPDEMVQEARRLSQELGIHDRRKQTRQGVHSNEYPEPRMNRAQVGRKVGRNELCPCGSGAKYKKCCGRTD
ncbi:YecA family protein [Planctomicrobium sp. SH661]|uniref:YecA family protein n=1 Tax=Planctomicrobium sp. SH661 TaxID=3448124 RepID=UPI003F5B7080